MAGFRALDTPLTVAVLSLLAERSRHPYDMTATLRERRVDDVVRMRGGSLYDAIARLEKAGLVAPTETGQQGARPERTVYSITPDGERKLRELVEEFLKEPGNEFPRFPAALAHILVLPPPTAAQSLRARAAILAAQTESELAAGRSPLPRAVTLESEYAQCMRECEIRWLYGVAHDIESGTLPWPLSALRWHEAHTKEQTL